MIITEEILALISKAPFVSIVTLSDKGEPHLIVVGGIKETREDDTWLLAFTKCRKLKRILKTIN